MPLTRHQGRHLFRRRVDPEPQAPDKAVVAFAALRGGLTGAHEGGVPAVQQVDGMVELAQVRVGFGQPSVIIGVDIPFQPTPQAIDPLTDAGRRRRGQDRLHARQALGDHPLPFRGQVIGTRNHQHRLQFFADALALLEAQTHLRIELPELAVDHGKQRHVIGPSHGDKLFESIQVLLPDGQFLAQLLEVEIVFQRFLEVVRGHEFEQVVGFGRLRELAQPHDPVGVMVEFLAHQGGEELAFADAGD